MKENYKNKVKAGKIFRNDMINFYPNSKKNAKSMSVKPQMHMTSTKTKSDSYSSSGNSVRKIKIARSII